MQARCIAHASRKAYQGTENNPNFGSAKKYIYVSQPTNGFFVCFFCLACATACLYQQDAEPAALLSALALLPGGWWDRLPAACALLGERLGADMHVR